MPKLSNFPVMIKIQGGAATAIRFFNGSDDKFYYIWNNCRHNVQAHLKRCTGASGCVHVNGEKYVIHPQYNRIYQQLFSGPGPGLTSQKLNALKAKFPTNDKDNDENGGTYFYTIDKAETKWWLKTTYELSDSEIKTFCDTYSFKN